MVQNQGKIIVSHRIFCNIRGRFEAVHTPALASVGPSLIRLLTMQPTASQPTAGAQALELLRVFGHANVFPSQRLAFERADALNATADGPATTTGGAPSEAATSSASPDRRPAAAATNVAGGGTDLQKAFRRRAAERVAAARAIGRVGVYCVESEEPLVAVHRLQDEAEPQNDVQHQQQHQQTRFFVVASLSTIKTYVTMIPPARQHLYEIIREQEPCFLYVDAECDPDDAATGPEAEQTVDAAALSQPAPPLLSRKALIDHRVCPLDCPVTHTAFDIDATAVMLTELRSFLSSAIGLSIAAEDVVVLRSVDRIRQRQGRPVKFSQHYVVRPRDRAEDDAFRFESNVHVGVVVAAFVQHLYGRARTDARVHAALFYHGRRDPERDIVVVDDAPRLSQPLRSYSQSQPPPAAAAMSSTPDDASTPPPPPPAMPATTRRVPVMPLRCIVDEAVYSRNRMFRCLGSRKLGKTAALDLEPQCPLAAAPPSFSSVLEEPPPGSDDGGLARSTAAAEGGFEQYQQYPQQQQQQQGHLMQAAWFEHSLVSVNALALRASDIACGVSSQTCEDAFFAVMHGVSGTAAARAAARAFAAIERLGATSNGEGNRLQSVVQRSQRAAFGSFGGGTRLNALDFPALSKWCCEAASGVGVGTGGAARPHPGAVSGAVAYVSSLLCAEVGTAGGTTGLIVGVAGRRYCRRVGREHKSNGVYFVVRPDAGHAVQRCHDPDCYGYSSPPQLLPADAVAELSKLQPQSLVVQVPHPPVTQHLHTPGTMEETNKAARELARARRTVFQPAPSDRPQPPAP